MTIENLELDPGDKVQAKAGKVNHDFLKSMMDFNMSDEEIKRLIDNLNISADAKSSLYSFSRVTIKVGEYALKIGRKIIDFVCLVFKEYQSASFGMIFGAIAGYLISSIPIIGVVLGPVFTPIAIALGLVVGYYGDLNDKFLLRRIAEINSSFSPLVNC